MTILEARALLSSLFFFVPCVETNDSCPICCVSCIRLFCLHDKISNLFAVVCCCTPKGSLLKKIIEAVRDLVTDANLDCSESGISMQAMDSSHVSLCALMIRCDGFDHYRCSVFSRRARLFCGFLNTEPGPEQWSRAAGGPQATRFGFE